MVNSLARAGCDSRTAASVSAGRLKICNICAKFGILIVRMKKMSKTTIAVKSICTQNNLSVKVIESNNPLFPFPLVSLTRIVTLPQSNAFVLQHHELQIRLKISPILHVN